ncbi:uncharacterized protein BO80DRAFT_447694 [Aspergillus ibericus CBS 121593]|uniref:DUF7136 domain-containing protein n=1 Tax=Aspergillus ibericus CBS 121593 TaxID=1448316 RepID=A0A395GRT3_9EURO|nr:hypothetical protein BO80DRAFT_447694 [Aspergillus ibericus CBS 121593]RAK98082.1 hypothetical protein BO80DRAFT_447694 [Aspergillus ibericus CBS 121593]
MSARTVNADPYLADHYVRNINTTGSWSVIWELYWQSCDDESRANAYGVKLFNHYDSASRYFTIDDTNLQRSRSCRGDRQLHLSRGLQRDWNHRDGHYDAIAPGHQYRRPRHLRRGNQFDGEYHPLHPGPLVALLSTRIARRVWPPLTVHSSARV